jgi:hypothetical protein
VPDVQHPVAFFATGGAGLFDSPSAAESGAEWRAYQRDLSYGCRGLPYDEHERCVADAHDADLRSQAGD